MKECSSNLTSYYTKGVKSIDVVLLSLFRNIHLISSYVFEKVKGSQNSFINLDVKRAVCKIICVPTFCLKQMRHRKQTCQPVSRFVFGVLIYKSTVAVTASESVVAWSSLRERLF